MPKNLLSKLPNKKYKIKLIGKKTKINIWELNTITNLLFKNFAAVLYYVPYLILWYLKGIIIHEIGKIKEIKRTGLYPVL